MENLRFRAKSSTMSLRWLGATFGLLEACPCPYQTLRTSLTLGWIAADRTGPKAHQSRLSCLVRPFGGLAKVDLDCLESKKGPRVRASLVFITALRSGPASQDQAGRSRCPACEFRGEHPRWIRAGWTCDEARRALNHWRGDGTIL